MNQEKRICQNCHNQFIIEPEDFQFYERIKVPPPTFCPNCRFQRRLAWFNLINLYRRSCDLCKKDTISMYSPEAQCVVYCPRCWWSDNWDPLQYGRDYDFSRPFFEQFGDLLREAPLLGLSSDFFSDSSPYTNFVGHAKNCYLLFWSDFSEDCAYGFYLFHDRNLYDCSLLKSCEKSYELTHAYKTAYSVGSLDLTESLNCIFMRDSRNCQNCFGSANLRNKKYFWLNKQLTKEKYLEKIKKLDLGSYREYTNFKKTAEANWKNFLPQPYFEEFNINCTGNRIYESKNCRDCFEAAGAENCKWVSMVSDPFTRDSYDISGWGFNLELSYDCGVVGENSSGLKFCHDSGINSFNLEYCKQLFGGSNQFGCVSTKKGSYCILNKTYTESEYCELRDKIISHMNVMPYKDARGITYRYGEFFPIELSPIAYNETLANKFFPLSSAEAIRRGYKWREADARTHPITCPSDQLPDHIKDVPETIFDEIIGCSKCPRGFKIIPAELAFLKQINLPLPRCCPFCRIEQKIDVWVQEFSLVERICNQCGAKFQTPQRNRDIAKLYCKPCYLETIE